MKKRVRILEVIRQGIVGGGETHVLELTKRLDRKRFDPVVLSFTNGPMIEQLNELEIENHVIPTERPFDISIWKSVRKLILKNKIELIHAHGTRAMSNVFRTGKRVNLPLVYTVHGWSFHDDQSNWVKRLRILSERFLCGKANITINVSEANQRQGQALFKNFSSSLIRNGIDLVKFNPDLVNSNIRTELDIPENVTLIGFVSRLTKQKDPITLINAFKKAVEHDQNLRLLIVGEGELEDEVKVLVETYGIKDRVYLLPFRRDVPELLKAIDLYCLPSLWEGLPIGLLEAMAMGKAVIATDVDGTSEVISNNENGILINPGDVEELAQKILLLHQDKNFRTALSRSARATVKEKYNVDNMVAVVEEIYSSLLQ